MRHIRIQMYDKKRPFLNIKRCARDTHHIISYYSWNNKQRQYFHDLRSCLRLLRLPVINVCTYWRTNVGTLLAFASFFPFCNWKFVYVCVCCVTITLIYNRPFRDIFGFFFCHQWLLYIRHRTYPLYTYRRLNDNKFRRKLWKKKKINKIIFLFGMLNVIQEKLK